MGEGGGGRPRERKGWRERKELEEGNGRYGKGGGRKEEMIKEE